MQCKLHRATLYLLHNRPRLLTYAIIGKETGLGAHWVRKFAQDKNPNPGVNSVERLYIYLSGKELNL